MAEIIKFDVHGLSCRVEWTMHSGWRGYVEIKEYHPLYGVRHQDLPEWAVDELPMVESERPGEAGEWFSTEGSNDQNKGVEDAMHLAWKLAKYKGPDGGLTTFRGWAKCPGIFLSTSYGVENLDKNIEDVNRLTSEYGDDGLLEELQGGMSQNPGLFRLLVRISRAQVEFEVFGLRCIVEWNEWDGWIGHVRTKGHPLHGLLSQDIPDWANERLLTVGAERHEKEWWFRTEGNDDQDKSVDATTSLAWRLASYQGDLKTFQGWKKWPGDI